MTLGACMEFRRIRLSSGITLGVSSMRPSFFLARGACVIGTLAFFVVRCTGICIGDSPCPELLWCAYRVDLSLFSRADRC